MNNPNLSIHQGRVIGCWTGQGNMLQLVVDKPGRTNTGYAKRFWQLEKRRGKHALTGVLVKGGRYGRT